jgi:ABC-type molybdate transport system permease subunit
LQQKLAANRQGRTNQEAAVQTKLKDNGRMWLWGFLAVIVMSQLYVVRELLAAFALFALGFATIAFVVASLYMLPHCWELAVARLADIRRPVMNVASVSRENQKAA